MNVAKDKDGKEWRLVSDKVWSSLFLQCPKCNDGVNLILSTSINFNSYNAETIEYQPILCNCGHILTHDEIMARWKDGYSVPSRVFVCPNCHYYQHECFVMTDIQYVAEEGEEWKSEVPLMKTVTFDSDVLSCCKKCHSEYKCTPLIVDGRVLHGLWQEL